MMHLKPSFLLIAVVRALLTNLTQASPTLTQQETKPKKEKNVTQDISDTPSGVYSEINSKQPEPSSNNQTRKWIYELWRKENFFPSIWSNWALVLVAFGAAYIGLRTLSAIKRQADIAAKGVENSLQITKITASGVDVSCEAATAARKSAEVAEASLRGESI